MSVLLNSYIFGSAPSGPPTLSYTTDLVMRLDASVTASMTDAGSGACSAWADQTANGNNAAQATSANRPTIGTDTTSGLGKLTFDGTNDLMAVAHSASLMPSAGVAVFVACNITAWGGGFPSLVTKAPTAWNSGYHVSKNSGGTAFVFVNTVNASLGTAPTGRTLVTLNYDSGNLTSDLLDGRVDGATLASTGYNDTITANTSDFIIGALQAAASAGDYVQVDMFEILVYGAGLNSTNRNTVESYLTTKWSL